MGQLVNFKKVLGMTDELSGIPGGSIGLRRETPKTAPATAVPDKPAEKKVAKMPKASRSYSQALSLPGELHAEFSDVKYWAAKNKVIPAQSAQALLKVMLELFYKKYPDAKKFVDGSVK